MPSDNELREQQESEHNDIFDRLIVHPEIRRVSEHGFKSRNYRNAIFDSYVQLEEMVKKKTNYPKSRGRELIGVALMHNIFDVNNPLLLWSSLKTQAERDELEGFKHIFAGAIQGIKNPLSHSVDNQDPWRALNQIILANYLAFIVDMAKYRSPTQKTEKFTEKASARANEEELAKIRDQIVTDLKKARKNLEGLFRSGGVDYLHRISALTTWNHYKSNLEKFYQEIFSDFLDVYGNIEKLNEIIKISLGTVNYSSPRFNPHKKLAYETVKKIDYLLEKLK